MKKLVTYGVLVLLTLLCGVIFYLDQTAYMPVIDMVPYSISVEAYQVGHQGDYIYYDVEDDKGLIVLYPGARVDPLSYAKFSANLATQSKYDVVVMKFFLDLAIFGVEQADTVIDVCENRKLIMMGHALGGTMAATYANYNQEVDGMILLSAALNQPLRDIPTLDFRASNDAILKVDPKQAAYYPVQTTHVVIEGGNHAGYADYGPHIKDGPLETDTQQEQTIQSIVAWLEQLK
ncbi:MAG: alpha/beta hydrolase [Erysipelotrichaceae bacterium]